MSRASASFTVRGNKKSFGANRGAMLDAARRAALAGLQAFLDEDSDYTALLERLEHGPHRRLRFAGLPRTEKLENIWAFLEMASQLRHCHHLFQRKLRRLADNGVKNGDALEVADCGRLVDALDDLLGVCRVLYGRLFVKSNAIHSALEDAVATADGAENGDSEAVSAAILSEFLRSEQMSPEALANSALARFNAIIEFVEALSKALQGSSGYDSSDGDGVSEAPRLLHIAQENKHHIHLVQTEAREERELIALQTQFVGDRAQGFRDLSARKLILHVDVEVSVYGTRHQGNVGEQRSQYAHCFQDGWLVLSERGEDERFDIQQVLRLKDDAVFLEFLPDLVTEQHKMPPGTFVLITENESLAFSIQDEATRQQWIDAISGFLVSNDARSSTLTGARAKEALELPADVQKDVGDDCAALTQFPSFHDDPLPGVFWLCGGDREGEKAGWQLVEVALVAEHWLVVFCLDGWRKHSLLLRLDMAQPDATINEEQSGDKEWSLVIESHSGADTGASNNCIRLVSKKRTRIDFWFDQVAKVIAEQQAAVERAARGEREKQTRAASADRKKKAANSVSPDGFINARAKKRRANTVIVGADPTASGAGDASAESHDVETASRGSKRTRSDRSTADDKPVKETPARGAKKRKKPVPDDDENEVQGRGDDEVESTTDDTSAPTSTTAGPITAKTSKTAPAAAAVTPATLKNPKRRWMKRKSEDPLDTALFNTPASQLGGGDDAAKHSASDDSAAAATSPTTSTKNESKSAAGAGDAAAAVRIILTGIEATPAVRKKIRAIASAEYEEDIEHATHVVAPKDTLKRTVKLLCGISCCAHVLDERWLDESARVGATVYERTHCLKDAKAEAKWHFDLKKTMYDFAPAQRRGLFAGHTVFITNHKSILPPVKDLVKIVECAGGQATTKGAAGPSDLVITSEAAVAVASVQKALASANPQRIYSPELVLSSILQQHIDFDQHRVSVAKSGGSSSRRRK